MHSLVWSLLAISLHGYVHGMVFPSLPPLQQAPINGDVCNGAKSKRWRYDADVEVSTCRLDSGEEIVDPSNMSEDDIDEILNLYPGLLKTDEEISSVPIMTTVSMVPLDFGPRSAAPSASRLAQEFSRGSIQPIGLSSQPFASAARGRSAPSAASSQRTAAFGGSGCCQMTREWRRPNALENINGALRTIVHFPSRGIYQFINTGRCVSPGSACSGGHCYTDQITTYLAVFLPEVGENVIGFEPFSIDNLCSCLNIGQ